MGDTPLALIEGLCRTHAARWRIPVEAARTVPLDASLTDPARRQVVAERALTWLESRYAREAADQVVIGVMAADMYIADKSWRFALSARRRRAGTRGMAVISTARMQEEFYRLPPDQALLSRRLGKMLTKNVGVLFYGMPLSDDPASVMYGNVLSLDDLDRMRDGFDGR
jgi:predicted Zn-dependent protease